MFERCLMMMSSYTGMLAVLLIICLNNSMRDGSFKWRDVKIWLNSYILSFNVRYELFKLVVERKLWADGWCVPSDITGSQGHTASHSGWMRRLNFWRLSKLPLRSSLSAEKTWREGLFEWLQLRPIRWTNQIFTRDLESSLPQSYFCSASSSFTLFFNWRARYCVAELL